MKQALLIIDYTDSCTLKKYEHPDWGCTLSLVREMAPRLDRLIAEFRSHSLGEVIWVTCCPWVKGKVHPNIERLYRENPEAMFYTDGTGAEDFSLIKPLPAERIFKKNLYSAFSGTAGELDSYLQQQRIEHLAISGIYSTGCVNATICEAFHRGYKLTIISDCVETFDRQASQDYQAILHTEWRYMYGEVLPSGAFISSCA